MEYKFLNDIAKPWDELNSLLVQRYAFDPDLSDVTRMASALAVAIKHYPERVSIDSGMVRDESPENRLMSDVADASKHGKLDKPARRNSMNVVALFEFDEKNQFRFLRNAILINHASEGEFDFMVMALGAMSYWFSKVPLNVKWKGALREVPSKFYPTAFLYYNPKYCIHMGSTRVKFFKRNSDGVLSACEPPSCRFEVLETKKGAI